MTKTRRKRLLTAERVAEARERGQLTARRERLICCGVIRQSFDHLRAEQRRAIVLSEEAAEVGAVEKGGRWWRRLTRWGGRSRRIYDDETIPAREQDAVVVRGVDYSVKCLWYDTTAAVQPWYGEMHNGQRAGLMAFLWSHQNPHLAEVFDDVCPEADMRLLLPAPEALQAWHDATVVRLAQAIYQERAWDRMPILGDALEEAGCSSEEVLGHCRSARLHVRGCWLLDWLLDLK